MLVSLEKISTARMQKATTGQDITPLYTRFIVEWTIILDHLVKTSSRSIQKFTEIIQKRSQDIIT